MRVRDLSKVENKLLCAMEDFLADAITDNIVGMSEGDEDAAKKIAFDVTKAVKENHEEIALICYVNDDGSPVTKEDIKGQPMKIKVIKECLMPIMEIVGEFMNSNSSGGDDSGKQEQPPKVIPKRG